jgi:hypothetical protein
LESLKQYDVPIKSISLVASTLMDTKAIVKVNNEYSNKFEVHKGVKQGDPLLATLFSIAIDVIIRQLDTKRNISTRLKHCAVYAENILILARTKPAMIDAFNKLKMESIKYGLVINEKKKYRKCTRRLQSQIEDLETVNLIIGQVRSFKYQGATVNEDNSTEEEIKERAALGNKAYYSNKRMFQSKLISRGAILIIYWSVVRPVVTSACETWVLKEREINKLQVFERKIARKISGPSKENNSWQIKTNQELNQLINHKNIINFISAQRLLWLRHAERMSPNRSIKSPYSWKPLGARPVGRPKTREDMLKLTLKR